MTANATTPAAKGGSDFAELGRRINAAGLLQKRPGYYAAKITIVMLLFAVGWVTLFLVGASWYSLITAVFLAVMSTQIGFLGHEVAHKQAFRHNTTSDQFGLVFGNLLIGLSIGWWKDKHNKHHANPNHLDLDPDVGVGALVFTKLQAAARGRFGRLLSRLQAWLFFPLLLLAGLNMHVNSIRALFGDTIKSKRTRAMEGLLLLVHTSLYLIAVFMVLTPVQGLVFMAVHQALWGTYMGLSFAPNHKGMPYYTDKEEDFLRRQVLTSRNIRGGWLTDLLLGGLNYQIEHHLFPSMPWPALKKAQPIVRTYCDEIGVPYAETGFFRSYALVLRHLDEVGAAA